MLMLHMCRYALGGCVLLCSSRCLFGSKFPRRLSLLSLFSACWVVISRLFKLAGYIDVVGRSSPQQALLLGTSEERGKFNVG